jgi:multisubunit Na+/H+ antiporter MnhB subunit
MPKRRSGRWSTRLKDGSIAIVKLVAIVALPFIAYVRTSVFFYERGAPTWGAIAGGVCLTLALVALFASRLTARFRGRARARQVARWIAVPIAAAWCLSALFYLARVNAKSDQVHGYFLSVHPILRVALTTVVLVDPDLVITDAARVRADYRRMGLPVNDRTMHYVQRDGWVHAVDLRTQGRSEITNLAVQFYFWGMGFSTLRHVGTADHLHVQLQHVQAT